MMRNYFKFIAYLIVLAAQNWALANPAVDFFRAVTIDNDRTVKALLAAGFDPNTVNDKGQAGLYLAMKEESWKVAAALLAQPAIHIDATTTADETPLMIAALRGNAEWTQRLLDRGAAIDAPSPNRSTPLMMAARYGPQGVAELLLARGADPKLRNDRQMTAADFARSGGRESLAVLLDAAAAR